MSTLQDQHSTVPLHAMVWVARACMRFGKQVSAVINNERERFSRATPCGNEPCKTHQSGGMKFRTGKFLHIFFIKMWRVR